MDHRPESVKVVLVGVTKYDMLLFPVVRVLLECRESSLLFREGYCSAALALNQLFASQGYFQIPKYVLSPQLYLLHLSHLILYLIDGQEQ